MRVLLRNGSNCVYGSPTYRAKDAELNKAVNKRFIC
nr:MAG TPA: hypothetical protein [Caudoviricetes sp.]